MKLTGKAKQDFEKWYASIYFRLGKKRMQHIEVFYTLQKSMQYGVYVDWFDSVNYKVYVRYNEVAHKWNWCIDFKPIQDDCNGFPKYTLNEARTEAIKKANEIYNNK